MCLFNGRQGFFKMKEIGISLQHGILQARPSNRLPAMLSRHLIGKVRGHFQKKHYHLRKTNLQAWIRLIAPGALLAYLDHFSMQPRLPLAVDADPFDAVAQHADDAGTAVVAGVRKLEAVIAQ